MTRGSLVHLLLLVVLLAPAAGSGQDECGVVLKGIEEHGDGQTALNLADIKASMKDSIYDFSNPIIPTLAGCSSGE